MAGVNKVILIGNLGADPEVKEFSNGGKVARLRLAVSEKWKDREGNPREETEWFSLECWEKLAGIAERFLSKGSKVYIERKLKTDRWHDADGNARTAQRTCLRATLAYFYSNRFISAIFNLLFVKDVVLVLSL